MYSAVIFDCDGVLVDSEDGLSQITANVLNDYYHLPAKPEDFTQYIGMGEDIYIGEVVKKYGGVYNQQVKATLYKEYIATAKGIVKPFPGAVGLLEELRNRGYILAVASSADKKKVAVNIEILGLDFDYFDVVITGDDVTKKKPDPEIYLIAADACGVSKADCVIVEDAISGVKSGKNAGIDVVGFTSSISRNILLESGAKICIDKIEELLEVIS